MRHASLWSLTLASLVFGALLVIGGASAASDIGSLAAGYGALIIGSALLLGAGLAIQALIGRTAARTRREAPVAASTIQGHRVF
jgi:hypothetical protein